MFLPLLPYIRAFNWISSLTYTWLVVIIPFDRALNIKMQTISRSMLHAPTMRFTCPAGGAKSTTLTAQRRVCLVPGSAQLMGAGKNIRLAGSLSGAGRQVQQAVCSSGVAHPGEVRYLRVPVAAVQRNTAVFRTVEADSRISPTRTLYRC